MEDDAPAFSLFQLAAAQGLDGALWMLGRIYQSGSIRSGVAREPAKALWLNQLAAAQGHPQALYFVAECHDYDADDAEAIRWYRRAQAAGYPGVASDLERLGA